MVAYTDLSNVVAVDYRGFGDSTGVPSERGLIEDGQTAWNYVTSSAAGHATANGDPAKDVVLMGHSLGTGVASGLAKNLAARGMPIM